MELPNKRSAGHPFLRSTLMKIPHLVFIAVLAGGSAQAALTFVSVAQDLSNISPTSSVTNTGDNNDNLWWQRDNFGQTSETVLEMWDSEAAVITLTLTGLTSGETYDVYVNYVRFGVGGLDPDGDRGGALGSLDGSIYTLFNGAGGTAGTVGFAELTGHTEGTDRAGLRGYLGTAVANGSGEILVYANSGAGVEERVWLDGASYELIPEPSSVLLIGLAGGFGLLRRRR